MLITAINQIDPSHLEEVVNDMRTMGEPTIRVLVTDNGDYALEGSHRLAAAEQLGLGVNVIEMSMDDPVDFDHDIDDAIDAETCEDLIEYIGGGRQYDTDDFGEW